MWTWDRLKEYDGKVADIQFTRHADVQKRYVAHKERLKTKSGVSFDAVLRGMLFTGGKTEVLTPNEFPYDLEKGVGHMVYWMLPEGYIPIKEFRKQLRIAFGPEVIVLENAEAHKSVKSIKHYHVFMR